MIPTQNWPKPYLLQVHQQAVEHGYILLHPIAEEDAESLRQRLYRIRRRSDKSTASFIPPEYHLVMVGEWIADNGGTLPVIFNRLPDGSTLPNITPVDAETFAALTTPIGPTISSPPGAPKPAFEPPPDFNPQLDPGDISSFVERMTEAARKKAGDAGA